MMNDDFGCSIIKNLVVEFSNKRNTGNLRLIVKFK